MIKCRKCGKELDDNDKFCIYCGAKQEKKEDTKDITDVAVIDSEQPEEVQTEDNNAEEKIEDGDIVAENKTSKVIEINLFTDKWIKIAVISAVILVISGALTFKFYRDYTIRKNHKVTSETASNESSGKDNDNSKVSSSTKNSNEYIFAHSNEKVLTAKDIQGMSKDKLALARNEIFARHGYRFPSDPFKSYFESKSWYKVNANYSNDFKELSPLERHNIRIILASEGKSAAMDYDKDYYESSSKNAQQKAVGNYIRYMAEAINKNNFSIVSPYIASGSEFAKAQKKLVADSKGVKKVVQSFDIVSVDNNDNKSYKVKTNEKYIVFNNGKVQDKEVNCIYTVSEINNSFVIADIKN